MKDSFILQTDHLTKTFRSGDSSLTVLDNVSFSVGSGTSCAVVGPSGSGKTTLLGLCAGLDRPTSGSVYLDGQRLDDLNEDELASLRNKKIGFIFQTFQLIPTLTAIENVMVPVELRGGRYRDIYEQALELLDSVGLRERIGHYPAQLSGGEQQRVGIARAFINEPDLLFADEPTGNLDTETGRHIEEILFQLNSVKGTTLVIVTHDLELASQCDRVIQLKSGRIESDNKPEYSEGSRQNIIAES